MSKVLWERTFELSHPVDRVWDAYFELGPGGAPPAAGTTVQLNDRDGSRFEITDVTPNERFAYDEVKPSGTSAMTVVFEATDTGTRVVVTRAGFGGDDPDVFAESNALGWSEWMQDLAHYLETGLDERRHAFERSATGVVYKETSAGLVVRRVADGTAGAEADLRPGDLIVSVNGAAVYARSDMWFVQRLFEPGAEVTFGFVRDGDDRTATARMSPISDAVLGELGLGPRDREPSSA